MHDLTDFTVVTHQNPDHATIAVSGEIDLETCSELAHAAARIPLDGKNLHLDLTDVSFMDSSGLNLLIHLRGRLHTAGGHLAVTGFQPQLARLLELTDTYDLFAADTAAATAATAAETPAA